MIKRDNSPLQESLDNIFKKIVDQNLNIFSKARPFDENQPIPQWYRENEY